MNGIYESWILVNWMCVEDATLQIQSQLVVVNKTHAYDIIINQALAYYAQSFMHYTSKQCSKIK